MPISFYELYSGDGIDVQSAVQLFKQSDIFMQNSTVHHDNFFHFDQSQCYRNSDRADCATK